MNLYQLHTEPEKLYGWEQRVRIPEFAYEMALHRYNKTKKRSPDLEPAIATDPRWAYWYASNVIHGRWPKGEDAIAQDLSKSYLYTLMLKRSWAELGKPEAEEAIKNSSDTYGYLYRRRFDIAPYGTPWSRT